MTSWQSATVVALRRETPSAATIRMQPHAPFAVRAGQHVIVRLTAPDGYTASRSYSIASAPPPDGGPMVEFEITVQRLHDGEVSPFLCDELLVGDEIEVRGPIGGFFVWEPGTPAVFVGGGSGVVPLMAMLRTARQAGFGDVHLVVSARGPEELFYARELVGCPDVTVVYSRVPGPGARQAGRLAASDLGLVPGDGRVAYVCGSSGFADHAARLLMAHGIPTAQIKIERFGPSTGG